MKQQKQNTIKKVKVIGNQQYINFNTGEFKIDFKIVSAKRNILCANKFIITFRLFAKPSRRLKSYLHQNP